MDVGQTAAPEAAGIAIVYQESIAHAAVSCAVVARAAEPAAILELRAEAGGAYSQRKKGRGRKNGSVVPSSTAAGFD